MKNFLPTITIAALLLYTATGVQAATCRIGTAASQGSQNAYQRDAQAAQETAQRERSSSDILGKCVAGVTGVITAPQFTSLSDIFAQVKNKVCRIASDQVNGAVSDVNSQIGGVMSGITGQINNTGIGQVIGSVPAVGGPVIQPVPAGSPQSATFWSNIWK